MIVISLKTVFSHFRLKKKVCRSTNFANTKSTYFSNFIYVFLKTDLATLVSNIKNKVFLAEFSIY